MSGISLEKRVEQVGIALEKRGVRTAPTVRVGAALDTSGSTSKMYKRGIIQETSERLLAMALKFDDNGELDMWAFDNRVSELPLVTKDNIAGYVQDKILDNSRVSKWGGTSYAPPFHAAIEHYFGDRTGGFLGKLFGKSEPKAPAMVLFVTDGACNDEGEAAKLLREAAKHNMYWQMVGVGSASNFRFLQRMADDLPNVGFVNMQSLDMSDDDLYDQLVSEEFCTWIKSI